MAVESAAAEVHAAAGDVDAAMADASAAAAKHARDAAAAMGALGGEVASHVADVDLAHVPVEPAPDVEPVAFSRVLSSTPADEAVLSGGVPAVSAAASVQDDEEEAFEDAEGDVVDVFGEVGDAPVVESAPAPRRRRPRGYRASCPPRAGEEEPGVDARGFQVENRGSRGCGATHVRSAQGCQRAVNGIVGWER